ncbi:MAG: hypothetical protein ACJASQ_002453 [Crocinitomicaceae bacterium]|jgi:hypothetical protein
MEITMTVTAYAIYLPVVIFLTLFVAKTLFKNGKVFMLDIFRGREEIAFATNKLFEVGFYLMNIGFALLILKMSYTPYTVQSTIEVLSYKIGGFAIYLGIMLFLNLYLFFRGKSKSKENMQRNALLKMTPPNEG